MAEKKIIGLTETVTVYGKNDKKKTLKARIDSGATKGSIDSKLSAELELGPIIRTKLVKSAHGNTLRPVVEAKVKLKGKIIKSDLTIANREHMKYKVLIGQNMLKKGFLIDPSKK